MDADLVDYEARSAEREKRRQQRAKLDVAYGAARLNFFYAYVLLGLMTVWLFSLSTDVLRMILGTFYLWLFAKASAEGWCRWKGLSLGGRSVETVSRSPLAAASETIKLMRREQDLPPLIMAGLSTVASAIIGVKVFHGRPHPLMPHYELILVLGGSGLFLLGFSYAAFVSVKNCTTPKVQIDAEGIRGYKKLDFGAKFARWSQIAACDFVTERDLFGEVARSSLVCKDQGGKKLVTVQFDKNFDRDVANEVRRALTGQTQADWDELAHNS